MKIKVSYFIVLIIIITVLLVNCDGDGNDNASIRLDNAVQLTYSSGNQSAQNPAFSPDGQYILFTRFLDGYNEPPSELVIINISTGAEQIIVPASTGVEHISVPGPVWINGKITWSSDLPGNANEIYTANDDGTNKHHTTHPEAEGYYIEPVFNPQDTNKIIFEYVFSDDTPHQIAIVEIDEGNRITYLTDDPDYDDRLPGWSYDGNSILFQRADAGQENWQIYTAAIILGDPPELNGISRLVQPEDSANCDNSWYYDGLYILSSSDYEDAYNISIPNIFAFPVSGGDPLRITITPTNEDGAPSCSHDGKWIAFETHYGEDEENPSEIWIIETPLEMQ